MTTTNFSNPDAPLFCFTSDVDWASEAALMRNQELFDAFEIPLTYFVTHKSEYLRDLERDGKASLEAHPNFVVDSSHGATIPEVVATIRDIVPNATCYRSHRYFDVTDSSLLLHQNGFTHDSNYFSFLYKTVPFVHFSGTVRFPVFWEDGTHLFRGLPLDFASFRETFAQPGLTVIDTHPMHMAMNSKSFDYCKQVKTTVSREQWNQMDEQTLQKLECRENGIRDFVIDLLRWVREECLEVVSMADLYAGFTNQPSEIDRLLLK